MPNIVTVPVSTAYYQFDQQGVVFNMWYLAYMEEARNAYLGAVGYSLQDLIDSGHDIQVVHADLDWSGAIRYGESITAEVSPGKIGRTSFELVYALKVGDEARVRASSVYVIVDAGISAKAAIPEGLRAALAADSRRDG